MNQKKFNVTVRSFDPKQSMQSGQEFVRLVDSPDEEHAISAAMSNTIAFTTKSAGQDLLSIAFCYTAVTEGL